MKKVLTLVTAAAALASATPAHAELSFDGFYVGAFGGANWLQTSTRRGRSYDFNTGYAVGGILGYEWCNGIRTEFEAAYRDNTVRRLKLRGCCGSSDSSIRRNGGRFRDMSYLANILYDIPLCYNPCSWYGWDITPYVGAGLGYAYERKATVRRSMTPDGGCRRSAKRKGVAWQIIVGFAYPIWHCVDLALEYKFHQGRTARFYDHTLDAALRYHF